MTTEQDEPQADQAERALIDRHTDTYSMVPPGIVTGIAQFLNTSDSAGNAVAANLTSEHISEMLRQSGRGAEREYNDRKIARFVWAGFAVFAVLALIAIIVTLALFEMPDLLREIMFALAGLVGGFGAGYGYSHSRR